MNFPQLGSQDWQSIIAAGTCDGQAFTLAVAQVPKERTLEGTLTFSHGGTPMGKFRCKAESDYAAALEYGNAARDPMKPYGHIPVGIYIAARIAAAAHDPADLRSYGPNDRYSLQGCYGPALTAMAVRTGLLWHGGAPGPAGTLRPTHGCLRSEDATLGWAAQAVGTTFILAIEEV